MSTVKNVCLTINMTGYKAVFANKDDNICNVWLHYFPKTKNYKKNSKNL